MTFYMGSMLFSEVGIVYIYKLLVIDACGPCTSATFFPFANALLSRYICVCAFSMLLSHVPLPVIATAIRPSEDALTMLLITLVTTFIRSPICPMKIAKPMHTVSVPFALKLPTVSPHVHALAVYIVTQEFAIVA